jgi:hypothetical protein
MSLRPPCLQVGGLLLVAPEQRLSLQLKCQELALQGSTAGAAVVEQLTALARLPYLDVMDESDELLHHRWAADRPGAAAHTGQPSSKPNSLLVEAMQLQCQCSGGRALHAISIQPQAALS